MHNPTLRPTDPDPGTFSLYQNGAGTAARQHDTAHSRISHQPSPPRCIPTPPTPCTATFRSNFDGSRAEERTLVIEPEEPDTQKYVVRTCPSIPNRTPNNDSTVQTGPIRFLLSFPQSFPRMHCLS